VIEETFPYYVGLHNGKGSQPHVREANRAVRQAASPTAAMGDHGDRSAKLTQAGY
jgi:hypothetical protein